MEDIIFVPGYLWDGQSEQAAKNTSILVRNGRILQIGESAQIKQQNPNAKIVENADWLLLPAFVNAHDHGRGVSPVSFGAQDRALELWLQDLNKLPALPHRIACYYDGIRLASSGVGTVLHSHNPNSFSNIKEEMIDTAKGYRAAGVRSILCPLYLDQNKRIYYERDAFIKTLPEPLRSNFAAGIHDQLMSIEDYLELVDEICTALKDEINAGWVEVQLHPNGGQWCSDDALLRMKEYALTHKMHLHLHLLETRYQAEYAQRKWGKSFIQHYQEIGFLGPWVSFAHAVWLDEEDLKLIAASGARLVTNPSSNLRLRSGTFNLLRACQLSLCCGIGLDGCALDDDQDYLREIRLTWLNNRHCGVDAEISYMDVLKMATSCGAQIAASPLSEGILRENHNADFVCVSMSKLMAPYTDAGLDPLALLVQRGTRDCVTSVFVNGMQSWGIGAAYVCKEAKAKEELYNVLCKQRQVDNGRRDNELLIGYVQDFYRKTADR